MQLQSKYIQLFSQNILIVFKRISNIFDKKKDKKINLDYSLDNLYLSFYLIIEIISEKDSNKNYSDILSSKINPDINNFFLNLSLFTKNSNVPINISNFTKTFITVYKKTNFSENTIYTKFLEYLFLFALFMGKLDEKNLKSVIIDLLELKEECKNFRNLACYFLNSIKKDLSGNKLNNNTSMNYGDFPIISNIGERFKEDEKKKNANQLNLNNLK